MSLAIKSARAGNGGAPSMRGRGGYPMGDPGFFGGLLGGIKGAVGGILTGNPIAAVTGAVRGAVQGSGGMPGSGRALPRQSLAPQRPAGTVRRPTPGIRGAAERFVPGGRTGYETLGCPSGYHPNKSSYFLMDGTFVEEGTKCVKNRRRNPANPRALDRAIGRLNAGKRLQSKLSKYSTDKYTATGKRKDKC